MNQLPSNLPDISSARLPESYERAKTALTGCASLDECKGWADKAAALASYAKQAKDDTLELTARRIQGRAQRRAGELLKTFDARGGDRSKKEGDHLSAPISQRAAAIHAAQLYLLTGLLRQAMRSRSRKHPSGEPRALTPRRQGVAA